MTFDIPALTTGQIAVIAAIATLTAALLGGVFSLVVATVNALAAVRTAKINSRRDYRNRVLEPFLQELEADIPRLVEMSQILTRRSWNVYRVLDQRVPPIGQQKSVEDTARAEELHEELSRGSEYEDLSPANPVADETRRGTSGSL